jgi:hypothetical protein
MRKTAILLLLALIPGVLAQSLTVEIVDYRHSSRYIDKEGCYKGEVNGIDAYLAETIITIRVKQNGAPIPNADVRIVYEIREGGKKERKEEYFKTDVWGEAEIELPFVEREPVEVIIEAVAQPEEGLGGISGSTKIIVVPYMWRGISPREFLPWWTKRQ